jgi:MFS family permease
VISFLVRADAFRWMWAGETVSMVGDRVQEVAVAWLILDLTRSPLALGSVLAAAAVPRAITLLLAGAVTDRLSARTLMLAANAARGLLVLLLIGLVASGRIRLWHLYVIEVGFGVADAFFYPASAAIVPALVPDAKKLPTANALLGSSEQAAYLIGPAVGGALVAAVGTAGAMALNAASFFLAAAGVLPARARRLQAPDGMGSVWRTIVDGLIYARSNRQLLAVLVLVSTASLTYNGVFGVGLPTLARERFPQGSIALGAMLSAWGVGQLLGVLSAGVTGLPRRWGLLIIGMTCCEAVAFTLLGVAPNFWFASVVLGLLGFGVAYSSDVALPTWIQRRSAPELLGRVNSIVELPRQALSPISLVVMGVLAAHGLALAFFVAGAVMLVTAAAVGASQTVRNLT